MIAFIKCFMGVLDSGHEVERARQTSVSDGSLRKHALKHSIQAGWRHRVEKWQIDRDRQHGCGGKSSAGRCVGLQWLIQARCSGWHGHSHWSHGGLSRGCIHWNLLHHQQIIRQSQVSRRHPFNDFLFNAPKTHAVLVPLRTWFLP